MILIKTKRLEIKPITLNDLPSLVSEIGNWEVARWLTNVPFPYTLDDGCKWLEIVTHSELNLNIFKDKMLIGGIGLTKTADDDCCELGYWIGEKYWGNGYASEAVQNLLEYISDLKVCQNIIAYHMVDNVASGVLLKKHGFVEAGTEDIFSLSQGETIKCNKLIWG